MTCSNAKVIGKSLEAKVTLYGASELGQHIGHSAEELAAIFIVSKVEFAAEGEGSYHGMVPFLPNLSITIAKADGALCPRCWVHSDTVGSDPKHPELCARCAKILNEA